jgi:hypothetical protein
LPFPFDPFDPFHPYFQFVGAGPSGRCRSGSGQSKALDETTETDTNGHKRIDSVPGGRSVRMNKGTFLVGNGSNCSDFALHACRFQQKISCLSSSRENGRIVLIRFVSLG